MQSTSQRTQHTSPTNRHGVPSSRSLGVALRYVCAGIPVFPCDPFKRPLTRHGHHDATTDPTITRAWWASWPDALVGIPTGTESRVWVLDVDGADGRDSLANLMARVGIATIADLTPCVSRTPSGGMHLIFRLQVGERPRNRARDIAAGLDTRGVKVDGTSAGYFIAPASALPDGRQYQLVDAVTMEPIQLPTRPFENAAPAPSKLLELATFNAAQRAVIAASPRSVQAISDSEPAEWPAIFEQQAAAQREALARHFNSSQRGSDCGPVRERQRRYVESILARELPALAAMRPDSGRNQAAFRLVCRVGRWAHHGIIARDQLVADVLEACEQNGIAAEDGRRAVLATVSSGLAKSAADLLPELGVRHE